MFRLHHHILNTSKRHTRYYHSSLNNAINTNITSRLGTNNTITKLTTIHATPTSLFPQPITQQKRYMGGRRGGASAFKPRPPTAKQRKRYNRRQKELHHEKVGKHSAPGSKAGLNREMERIERKRLLDLHYGREDALGLGSMGGGEAIGGGGLTNNIKINADGYNSMDLMIDDFMGNTSYLSAKETPTRERIAFIYPKQLEKIQTKIKEKQEISDKEIALLIRSYRDTKTYNRRPIGAADVLTHLKQVGVPISLLNTFSYNALLSCALSPTEALHLIQDMKQHNIPRCPYTYSILVDLYANRGDFRSCSTILHKTLVEENINPTLAGYTSLLKACHKIVNKGATNLSLKHEALDVAWQAWKHMRIHRIDADVMTYGAIINVYAAAGQAEKCLDFLNEMPRFKVDPTTFVYTAALRGVARSHRNALRFEGGYSRLHRRREMIIRHHGKMARDIVIQAENNEVKLDDGFFAALMSCAAVAGDFATTKAIYMSYLVRKNCQFLRNIGDDDHLRRISNIRAIRQLKMAGADPMGNVLDGLSLDGTANNVLLPGNTTSNDDNTLSELLTSTNNEEGEQTQLTPQQEQAFIEEEIEAEKQIEQYNAEQTLREYGPDTRLLTSLLHSYSNAMQNPGLGTVWHPIIHRQQDDINLGYLDERTLDKIVKYPETISESNLPKDVPMEDMAYASKSWNDPEEDAVEGRKLKLKKFHLKQMNQGSTTDDFMELHYDQKLREEERMKGQEQSTFEEADEISDIEKKMLTKDKGDGSMIGTYYDVSKGQAEIKSIDQVNYKPIDKYESDAEFFQDQLDTFQKSSSTKSSTYDIDEDIDDIEKEAMQEFVAEKDIGAHFDRSDGVGISKEYKKTQQDINEKFEKLANKIGLDDLDGDLSDDQMMKLLSTIQEDFDFDDDDIDSIKKDMVLDEGGDEEFEAFDSSLHDIDEEEEVPSDDDEEDFIDDEELAALGKDKFSAEEVDEFSQNDSFKTESSTDFANARSSSTRPSEESMNNDLTVLPATVTNNNIDNEEEYKLQRISKVLPGMPRERLKRIINIYKEHLSDPSIISLVPVLRETLSTDMDIFYLRKVAYDNALVTMKAAEDDGLIDGHVLNGMLQVICNSRPHSDILEFYDGMENKYGVKPTPFDDRIVMDALLKKKFFNKALDFKRKVVEQKYNRNLDLTAYTTLVEYCGNRGQVGSALMLIQECKRVHGYPPNEIGVKHLRRYCNRKGIDIGLDKLVGPDPSLWRRKGEAELKREYSYKGRKDVIRIRNAAVSI